MKSLILAFVSKYTPRIIKKKDKVLFWILSKEEGDYNNRIVFYANGAISVRAFDRDFRQLKEHLPFLSFDKAMKVALKVSKEQGFYFNSQSAF